MNILLVFSDQQQRYALGCIGNPNVETPCLDRLAAQGVLFRRCYSNDPVCGPFRGTLMTGQYSSRCGVRRNGAPLPAGTPTFADAFRAGGYETSWVGKWHLGGTGNGPIPREQQGGFDRFLGYQCYNGFYDNVCFHDEAGREHRFERHRTEVTTDLAVGQLEQMAAGGRPFLLVVGYQAPHYPEQPSPEYEARYRGRAVVRRANVRDIDPYTPTGSPPSPRPFERDPDYRRYGNDLDEYIRLYNAMCTQVDANIGRLLAALERLGLSGETAVIFTSDHGDMQGSHGLKNKKLPHEESAGIPLVVHAPGLPSGRVSDALVSGIDLMPTCLDLAGLPPVAGVDGRSFAPLLRGDAAGSSEAVFCEHATWCMILRGSWKLVAERSASGLVPTWMTNPVEDPYEFHDRVADPALAGIREELLAELAAWEQSLPDGSRRAPCPPA